MIGAIPLLHTSILGVRGPLLQVWISGDQKSAFWLTIRRLQKWRVVMNNTRIMKDMLIRWSRQSGGSHVQNVLSLIHTRQCLH